MSSPNVPNAVFTGAISNGSSSAGTILNVTAVTSGTIGVGGTNLFDTSGSILPGTIVVSQLTGTPGGIGTYSVNLTQLVIAETMTNCSSDNEEIAVNINQTPTINSADVFVLLVI
jgi:hypothetical protein